MSNRFPIIEIEGDAYNCGWQYGKAALSLITENINSYLDLFKYHVGLNKDQALELAHQFIHPINEFDPGLIEELQGIADACNVDISQVMLLNARTELLVSTLMPECTSFFISPPASKPPFVWLAQNWDWLYATNNKTIILRIKQANKPHILMVAEAGQIGKLGMNNFGLGVAHNSLYMNYSKVGIPFLVLCRIALNEEYIVDALQKISSIQRASPGNFLLADKNGISVDIEMTPDDYDYFEPMDHILVHTNHFLSNSLDTQYQLPINELGWDSVLRKQRCQFLLKQNCGNINLNTIMDIQRDGVGGNASICVKPIDSSPYLEKWATLAGVIMDLTNCVMYITCGDPSQNDYVKVSF